MITEEKLAEWRQRGKEAYKSTARLARVNCHHPDCDSPEKVEALHDRFGDSYLLTEKRKDVLKNQWGYSEDDVLKAWDAFREGYNASRKWYKKADAKMRAIIDSYSDIWKKAEDIAKKVDVSDIKDGFPCGSAHLYLSQYPEGEDLRKALAHFSSFDSPVYKHRLPISFPVYGQCVRFDERICHVVQEFLRSKGIFASIHSWID